LANKPAAERFVDLYPRCSTGQQQQLYHRYQLQAGWTSIGRVLDAVRSDERFQQDTIVIFLSDHGELLGAHGRMPKWHNVRRSHQVRS
jgi:membrane-anchored protein YejM (alkaline phosphatase superfamily)